MFWIDKKVKILWGCKTILQQMTEANIRLKPPPQFWANIQNQQVVLGKQSEIEKRHVATTKFPRLQTCDSYGSSLHATLHACMLHDSAVR